MASIAGASTEGLVKMLSGELLFTRKHKKTSHTYFQEWSMQGGCSMNEIQNRIDS